MLIYHALAICVIVKTLSGEMHIQGSHNSKGIDSTIQSQNKQHFIVAVSDSRLAAMSKTIDETKDLQQKNVIYFAYSMNKIHKSDIQHLLKKISKIIQEIKHFGNIILYFQPQAL